MDSEVLLFDLGGVLIDYRGIESIRPWLQVHATDEELRAWFEASPTVGHFTRGQISSGEFVAQFLAKWPLSLGSEEFLSEFEAWTLGLYTGAAELLDLLRPRYRLAALSNTNELHWRRNLRDLGIGALFDHLFSSHQIGLVKPDSAAYRHVLDALHVEPREVTFFDDVGANVEAAAALGIDAHRVRGVDELRTRLRELGLL